MANLVGKRATIKATGDWGIIRLVEGDIYHIGMFGDTKSSQVFERSEFTVTRKKES